MTFSAEKSNYFFAHRISVLKHKGDSFELLLQVSGKTNAFEASTVYLCTLYEATQLIRTWG